MYVCIYIYIICVRASQNLAIHNQTFGGSPRNLISFCFFLLFMLATQTVLDASLLEVIAVAFLTFLSTI